MGDLLFEFTEWLRTTSLIELAFWISETDLSLWIVTHFWAIPTLQTLHILSIAAAFGAVLMMNLRVLNLAGGVRTVPEASRRYVPWMWWALVALAVTGVLMIVGEPIRELINPIFWVKMGLIIVLILVSLAFQARVRSAAEHSGSPWRASGGIKATAVLIILLWGATMFAGRWIAYAPV